MAESKDFTLNSDENGVINIAEDVIATIAAIAAGEVEGVFSLASPGVDIAELLGKKSMSKGVKIQLLADSAVAVDVFIVATYGFTIPQVAMDVQNAVSSAVSAMSGIHSVSVNVHVVGVAVEKQEQAPAKTDDAE